MTFSNIESIIILLLVGLWCIYYFISLLNSTIRYFKNKKAVEDNEM